MRGGLLALVALSAAASADAQVSGSASIVSDYRFRGVTLSDELAAAQAAVLYDHPGGAYIGGFVSTVRLEPDGATGVQGLGQVGYAVRGPGDLTWDAGALYTDFSRPRGLGYADFYLGAAAIEWAARLSHAPRYFGQPYSATYAEVNVTPSSDGAWSPLLHVGWLVQHPPPDAGQRSRWDARAGVAYTIDRFTLQLSWVTASGPPARLYDQHRSRWVLKATAWLP